MDLKFEYSQNNHYKWGFGNEWHNTPSPDKQYQIHLGYCTRPVKRFREECITAAELIAKNATQPIIVGLSGGSDSQMVCLSYLELGIPIKAVIVKMFNKYNNLINGYDIKTAYEFCKKYSIEYIEHEINVHEFYHGKAREYSEKYGFGNPNTIIQCSTMDLVCQDYCYIMAGGDVVIEPYPSHKTPDISNPLIPNLKHNIVVPSWLMGPQPIMQHMMTMGYEGTSKFYLYTPELIASYLTDSAVTDFLRSSNIIYEVFFRETPKDVNWWQCFSMYFKPLMTMREWPEIVPARKYTGFELLQITERSDSTPENYEVLLRRYTKGMSGSQMIATPISDLIEYVTTPHTHALKATRWNRAGIFNFEF